MDAVRVTKVKGHADAETVQVGQVRELDKLGNDAADEAADFGRRRVDHAVIDARRNLSGACERWYPIILDLRLFIVAVSRAMVYHDDLEGTARTPSLGLLVGLGTNDETSHVSTQKFTVLRHKNRSCKYMEAMYCDSDYNNVILFTVINTFYTCQS